MIHFLIDLKRTDKLKILKISQMMDNYVLHNFVFVSEMIRWSPGPQIDEKRVRRWCHLAVRLQFSGFCDQTLAPIELHSKDV